MNSTTLRWTLGDRLAKARRHARLSTTEMAEELGFGRYTIHNYESDRTRPNKGTLMLWAIRCDVDYEWLVGNTAEVPDTPPTQERTATPRFDEWAAA